MFGDQGRVIVGGGIAAALVFAIWTMWPASPAPSAAGAPARARGARGAASQNASADPVPAVKLGSLTESRREPAEAPRNPFRYEPKAPPPAPKRVEAPPAPIEAPKPGPVVPAGPPALPPIQLKFIGVLERSDGTKWAALSDGKARVMQGKEGDIIDGQYRLVKIGAESVEMTYVDGRGRQVIRLTGQ
jgi:hypothetical protein